MTTSLAYIMMVDKRRRTPMTPLEVLVRDKRNAQTFWIGFLDWILIYEKAPRFFERVR